MKNVRRAQVCVTGLYCHLSHMRMKWYSIHRPVHLLTNDQAEEMITVENLTPLCSPFFRKTPISLYYEWPCIPRSGAWGHNKFVRGIERPPTKGVSIMRSCPEGPTTLPYHTDFSNIHTIHYHHSGHERAGELELLA